MKVLGNAVVFVVLYILFMLPTYYLPYLGSNSALIGALGAAAGAGVNPAFWLHLGSLLVLVIVAWFRGALVDKNWLIIFPILATVFDLAPALSSIPLVPTVMHLLAIILGVAGAKASVLATSQHLAPKPTGIGLWLGIAAAAALVAAGYHLYSTQYVVPFTTSPSVPRSESPGGSPAATAAEATPAASGPTVRVRTDVFDIEIDPVGGDIVGARLLNYPVSIKTPDQPFVLMDHSSDLWYITQGGWLSSQEAPTHHSEYRAKKTSYMLADGEDSLEVRLTWTSETGISIAKVYTFRRESYLFDLHYDVENKSSQSWSGRPYEQLQRSPTQQKNGGFLSGPTTFTGAVVSSPEERYEKLDFQIRGQAHFIRRLSSPE